MKCLNKLKKPKVLKNEINNYDYPVFLFNKQLLYSQINKIFAIKSTFFKVIVPLQTNAPMVTNVGWTHKISMLQGLPCHTLSINPTFSFEQQCSVMTTKVRNNIKIKSFSTCWPVWSLMLMGLTNPVFIGNVMHIIGWIARHCITLSMGRLCQHSSSRSRSSSLVLRSSHVG